MCGDLAMRALGDNRLTAAVGRSVGRSTRPSARVRACVSGRLVDSALATLACVRRRAADAVAAADAADKKFVKY